MKPWFTVAKIDGSTYAISEYRHWEETQGRLRHGSGIFKYGDWAV